MLFLKKLISGGSGGRPYLRVDPGERREPRRAGPEFVDGAESECPGGIGDQRVPEGRDH